MPTLASTCWDWPEKANEHGHASVAMAPGWGVIVHPSSNP
jgi:hypothetical protein